MAPSTYYQPDKGRGHLDLHLLFVVIENCRFNRSPLSTGDCSLKKNRHWEKGGSVFGCQTRSRRWYWCVSVCAGFFFFLFSPFFPFLSFFPFSPLLS